MTIGELQELRTIDPATESRKWTTRQYITEITTTAVMLGELESTPVFVALAILYKHSGRQYPAKGYGRIPAETALQYLKTQALKKEARND